jgi:hypothetical protein
MLITIFTIAVFYVIFIHPMVKDARGGYQSKYDTLMDNYIDLELSKRYTKEVRQRELK